MWGETKKPMTDIEYQTNASRALALGCFGDLSIVLP